MIYTPDPSRLYPSRSDVLIILVFDVLIIIVIF